MSQAGMLAAREPVTRPPRITAISYKGLSRLVHSLMPDYAGRAQITVLDKVFDDAVDIARELVERGEVDVFLSAGANGTYLKDTFTVPVVRVPVTGVDLMRALIKARRLSDQIAVVTFRQTNSELDEIKQLLNLDIEQRSYTTIDDAREAFRELASRGYKVIVGSSLVTELAERQGLIGILAYSPNSVRQAIDDAIDIAHIRAAEERRAERVNIILRHLSEGVLAVDDEERVQLVNPAMESLTGLSTDALEGRRLSELAPSLGLAGTIRQGQASLEKIERFGSRTLVTNRIPIKDNDLVCGAVLTVQDTSMIERVDRNIRSRNRRRNLSARYSLDDIIGASPAMRQVTALCARYADTNATVLITGETGTGKEIFAQGIHNASSRRDAPFVAVNCAAIPDSLLESELFGYEEGAFTGSRRGGQSGLFELAHTGTIFLDEIAEMPVALQTRLLRVLQEKEVVPLGRGDPIPIDVRVIAATNRDLRESMESGALRSDLYYRLNILRIHLPALSERGEDVLDLARRHLAVTLAGLGSTRDAGPLIERIAPFLRRYGWPGNVREMENVIERLAVMYAHGDEMLRDTEAQLRAMVPEFFATPAEPGREADHPDSLKAFVEQNEYSRIVDMVAQCNGNISEAARRLKLSRTTLWRKLRRHRGQHGAPAFEGTRPGDS
ncbi:MAG TPA: propionate catabolism operon regulatory protein PrpR [Gammaproteobacteria bacterium]|nr:propionate catabolism operon regulatory protein PrpR [Gammaproteobacteria bacterium]